MNKSLKVTLVSLLVGVLIAPNVVRAENPPRKILTGWIPYYRTYSSAGKTNGGLDSALSSADLIKEVMPFWYQLDGPTKIEDLYTPANPSRPANDALNQLKLAGYSIIPTMTDGTSSRDPSTGKMKTLTLSNLIADSAGRDVVTKTITDFVVSNNFDGIDLDFENFAFIDPNTTWDTTRIRWAAFIKTLAASLHANKKLLSMTTPVAFDPSTGKKGYYVYAWQDVASDIDRLRIMTYDYSTSAPGPIGPITWVEQAVQWAVKVMPASKVFIGLPGYGRDWVTSVTGVCPTTPINYTSSIKVGASASTFVMRDATALASANGATPTYQAKYGESTFSYQKTYTGNTAAGVATQCTAARTAWYQDAQGFGLRANLVAKYRLGGLTQWTLGMEDPAATEAIRTVAKSIAPDVVNALLTSSVLTITYGDSIALNGTLLLADKSPLVGVDARTEYSQAGGWNTLQTSSTSVKGDISSQVFIGENTKLRLTSDATWERLAATSSELLINVARKITWRDVPIFAARNQSFTLSGRIEPMSAINLNLQSSSSSTSGIKTVQSDANGYFTFSITEKNPGLVRYQVNTPAGSRFVASSGDFVTVLIR